MIKLGLTGGIGSGKSTVAGILDGLGADVIDADQVSRDVYEPESDGFTAVVDTFGASVIGTDGKIDRRALGELVFTDDSARRRLENAVWPVMEREFRRRFTLADQAGAEVVCLEAAVLIEAKWNTLVDEVWVVAAPAAQVINRLLDRDGLTEQQVNDRLRAQLPVSQKIKIASVVINNDGSTDHLRESVILAWSELLDRSSRPPLR